jgi:hypothetical protein
MSTCFRIQHQCTVSLRDILVLQPDFLRHRLPDLGKHVVSIIRFGTDRGLQTKIHSYSRSSKTRRREERKKARGKKGTIYEEEYLVGSLKRLYERASGMQCKRKKLFCIW